jgi:hypothetical protein
VLLNLAQLRLQQQDGAGALRCCEEVLAQRGEGMLKATLRWVAARALTLATHAACLCLLLVLVRPRGASLQAVSGSELHAAFTCPLTFSCWRSWSQLAPWQMAVSAGFKQLAIMV